MERPGRTINTERGFGIIECMISILLLTFMLVGGMSFYIYSNEHLKLMTYQRMAADLANSRMENIRQAGYSGLSLLSLCPDPNPDNSQRIGFLQPAVSACLPSSSPINDGCANCRNYKPVKVTVRWTQPGQNFTTEVTLDSFIAEQ